MKHGATIEKYFVGLAQVLPNLPTKEISEMVEYLLQVYREGGTVFTMGNGGHGSTAAHAINDLNKHTVSNDERTRIAVTGKRFRAVCLNDSISTLTAWANDMGWENVFSQQLENWVKPGDLVIGISESGNSRNILKAFEVAKASGAKTICLSGLTGGKARDLVNLCILVPSEDVLFVEDTHLAIFHCVCQCIRKALHRKVN